VSSRRLREGKVFSSRRERPSSSTIAVIASFHPLLPRHITDSPRRSSSAVVKTAKASQAQEVGGNEGQGIIERQSISSMVNMMLVSSGPSTFTFSVALAIAVPSQEVSSKAKAMVSFKGNKDLAFRRLKVLKSFPSPSSSAALATRSNNSCKEMMAC
jgi:hypothetical protein